jgi:hypothetical protein
VPVLPVMPCVRTLVLRSIRMDIAEPWDCRVVTVRNEKGRTSGPPELICL